MQPRFVGRLGVADAVTTANAALGFLAVVTAPSNPRLAARIVLVAAIADGLDGVVARRLGSTPAGKHLDSLADVASFGVAPACIVVAATGNTWQAGAPVGIGALVVGAGFVASAVVRLGLYTAYDTGHEHTEGVQTTLAATLLAAGVLAGVEQPTVIVGAAGVLAVLMVSTIEYPDLLVRDALAMGVVQAGAVVAPAALAGAFPKALLGWAGAYLVFAPRFYWRAA
ncbi:protein sorting system archaetidylserine synthase [Halobacterium salinarum]|uniref:Archaetidylserine synthase n=1 Tax=Halobacterium salinarum (strain ATCC 33171 / DSM 3754 / JCM 8978 / NBRC 102687 / NCIMB 764 / 91-R6) TaxID=2597657 RepID=A0A4D6GS09_HALS9|nr:protein sorting system archaetidylserine synthase [Halobacterium salinarum]MDL0124328.1 protein sorting system archaetidylserine synthase [Halobacterium salinarum]MDL0137680.1 protein sorting system archaetidylserine synthase [Halobacterium salinarum]MDL0144277.1 protein sorting system archaetidylserine synthase [Halobacterium salinarum]QCC44534.1 putative archaetidylserine synthase [Halobacterium salinarum]TYO76419.1 archaetidylserine synthase [Halobacterium salinarum DSM 3754]